MEGKSGSGRTARPLLSLFLSHCSQALLLPSLHRPPPPPSLHTKNPPIFTPHCGEHPACPRRRPADATPTAAATVAPLREQRRLCTSLRRPCRCAALRRSAFPSAPPRPAASPLRPTPPTASPSSSANAAIAAIAVSSRPLPTIDALLLLAVPELLSLVWLVVS